MYDFPNTPNPGDTFAPPGGPTWRWNGSAWGQIPPPAVTGLPEAPIDGINYVRKNAAWVTLPVDTADWASITGKPATFPPTLPIAQSDVTGLTTALAGKSDTSHTHSYSSLTGIPSSFTPSAHNHPQSEITNLVSDLSGKEPTIAAGTAAQYWVGTKTWATLDKAAVGLANVDNTADSAKPVSTLQAAADALNVLKAGDTMTGDFNIAKASPTLGIDKAAGGQNAILDFKTGGLRRWIIYTNTTAEGGSNAGSNLAIGAYADNGTTSLSTPLIITRSTGKIAMGKELQIHNATAVPAGGTTGAGYTMSSVANLGIFFGSGAPTLTAAQGSLYIRTDGSSTSTRLYVNTTGAAVWVNFTSAS